MQRPADKMYPVMVTKITLGHTIVQRARFAKSLNELPDPVRHCQ